MVRETSVEAFIEITTKGLLSQKRMEIYKALQERNQAGEIPTASELFYSMKESRNPSHSNVTTRLGELRELGVVREVETRLCSVTGRNVITWEVTNKLPGKISKPRTVRQKLADLTAAAAKLRQAQRSYSERHGTDDQLNQATENFDRVMEAL